MNKFLKLMIIPAAFLTIGTSTSCAPSPKEIALITDIGDIDDGSFNQESWEAIKEYAEKNHKSYDFYRPFNDSEFARNCSVKQAVAKGAKVIILPGFKFASTCANVMRKYPNVNFLLIDSVIHNGDYNPIEPTPNICCVGFKSEYSGYIAGYAIATDLMKRDWADSGETKLPSQYGYGYAGGMASDGVYQFGFGFIQGVCQATANFCKDNIIEYSELPNLRFKYTYAGVFAQDDATTAKVKGWYVGTGSNDEVKVVFPCGGKLYQSVTEAAQHYNMRYVKNYSDWLKGKLDHAPRNAARWVGVDSDQYRGLKYDYEKKSIYTSALKGLKPAITHALKCHYDGEWAKRIGGNHHEHCPVLVPDEVSGKWMLGLKCTFGDYTYPYDNPPLPDDYVGIPVVYDEKTSIMRSFDNFAYDDGTESDYLSLYSTLTRDGSPTAVYAGNGADDFVWEDHTIEGGYPDGMPEWEDKKTGKSYREIYLSNYPKISEIKTE